MPKANVNKTGNGGNSCNQAGSIQVENNYIYYIQYITDYNSSFHSSSKRFGGCSCAHGTAPLTIPPVLRKRRCVALSLPNACAQESVTAVAIPKL